MFVLNDGSGDENLSFLQLKVTWDEPEVLQNVKKVSPWQVELVSATPQIQAPFPASKKMRQSPGSEILTDGEDPMFFTGMGLSLLHYKNFPVGMQGARHNLMCVPNLTNFLSNNHSICSDNLCGNGMTPKSSGVSTELSIGSFPQSDNSSLKSQGNTHFIGTELYGNQSYKPTKKDNGNSMKLFGQTIKPVVDDFDNNRSACDDETQGQKVTKGVGGPLGSSLPYPYKQLFGQTILTKKPVEDGFDNNGFTRDDEINGQNVTEGVGGPLGTSLAYPYKQLCNQLDVQCQRVSAVEACSL